MIIPDNCFPSADYHGFRICTILPFFRYAVCPLSNLSPGVPFYTLKGARKLYEQAIKDLPWCGVVLLRRRYGILTRLSGMEIVETYIPKEPL